MKTRPTPARLALWAALPMAEAPKIGKRLTMILDPARPRRALTRRARLAALALATAALVPLATLHPAIRARATGLANAPAQAALSVQLMGVTDATVPAGEWWDSAGKRLASSPLGTGQWHVGERTTVQPAQIGRYFAFRLSPALRNVPVLYDFPDYTLGGLTFHLPKRRAMRQGYRETYTGRMTQSQFPDGFVVCGAAFPTPLSRTNVRVGTGSGPWVTVLTIHYQFKQGRPVVNLESGSRSGPPAAVDLSGGNVKYSIQTDGPSDDQHFDRNFRVMAVDKQGHASLLSTSWSETGNHRRQITARQPQNLSSLQAIRVESQPFAWTEFNDVALQPTPSPQSGPEGAIP